MKIVFATDSLKGTIDSRKAAEILTKAAENSFPKAVCVGVCIADGGEGTVESVLEATASEKRTVYVHGPLDEKVAASYAIIDQKQAVIEMAEAVGMTKIDTRRSRLGSRTSKGLGEMILDALNQNIRDIVIGIGGSATNDGGMGAMEALGVRFLDERNRCLPGCGDFLSKVYHIDESGLDVRLKECRIRVMSDVDNRICGDEGAVMMFGTQKGASEEEKQTLEEGMRWYAEKLTQHFQTDVFCLKSGGAAGGMGAALQLFLKAEVCSGITMLLSLVQFENIIQDADLVITGEGRIDGQSHHGKAVSGIARLCKKHQVPVVVLAGSRGEGAEAIYEDGVTAIVTAQQKNATEEELVKKAEEWYQNAAESLFRLLALGKQLS